MLLPIRVCINIIRVTPYALANRHTHRHVIGQNGLYPYTYTNLHMRIIRVRLLSYAYQQRLHQSLHFALSPTCITASYAYCLTSRTCTTRGHVLVIGLGAYVPVMSLHTRMALPHTRMAYCRTRRKTWHQPRIPNCSIQNLHDSTSIQNLSSNNNTFNNSNQQHHTINNSTCTHTLQVRRNRLQHEHSTT